MFRQVGRVVAIAIGFASMATAQRPTTEPVLVLAASKSRRILSVGFAPVL